ncbi:MAG: type II toxin-antitoxin system RelE/ParE family toxin [Bacteroidota bacterium]|nr:type II toxin-antitoxin system RelE/ParE family toxin [Bacteroidota bacterium]
MDVRFDNEDLEKLYTEGKSKKYSKLPSDIVDKFFARIQQIEAANDIYDLWNDKGLNFERLQGFKSRYSMRLKLKYRLEMIVEWQNNENTVGEFIIIDMTNHYS